MDLHVYGAFDAFLSFAAPFPQNIRTLPPCPATPAGPLPGAASRVSERARWNGFCS